jgi:hypothetical protein
MQARADCGSETEDAHARGSLWFALRLDLARGFDA